MTRDKAATKGNKAVRPRHYVEYWALRAVNAFFHVIGLDRASATGGWLLRKLGPLSKYDTYARNNLKMCLPDLNQEETDKIVREMWDNFGRTVGEFLLLDQLLDYSPDGRVEFVNGEIIDRLLAEEKPIIFFTGHFANWELATPYLIQKGHKIAGIYRAANNPLVDKWIVNTRQDMTFTTLLPKGRQGAAGAIRSIRNGEHLGMLVDQKLNEGIDVPFFGHNAKTAAAAGLFAVKYGCPLLPVGIKRVGGAHFKVTIFEPVEVGLTGNQAEDIYNVTKRCNEFLEHWIRLNPGQWLWMHNRWTSPFRKRYLKRPKYRAQHMSQ